MQQLATLSPLHCAMLAGCQDAAQVSEAWAILSLGLVTPNVAANRTAAGGSG